MPTAYMSKMSKEKNIPIAKLEKYWDKAKSLAKDSGHEDEFDYITGIFNKMIKEDEDHTISKYADFLGNQPR
jgi:hypothetical protein